MRLQSPKTFFCSLRTHRFWFELIKCAKDWYPRWAKAIFRTLKAHKFAATWTGRMYITSFEGFKVSLQHTSSQGHGSTLTVWFLISKYLYFALYRVLWGVSFLVGYITRLVGQKFSKFGGCMSWESTWLLVTNDYILSKGFKEIWNPSIQNPCDAPV